MLAVMRITVVLVCLAMMQTSWGAGSEEPLARIRLYNPTGYAGPMVVEVPVGRIANPELTDWTRVRLVSGGKELPHAIREGRANWRATLTGPDNPPRPEDLLLFSATVLPGKWFDVHVVHSVRTVHSTPASLTRVSREGNLCRVTYDSLDATVDADTGQLLELSALGVPVSAGPLTMAVHELEAPGYSTQGGVGPGYQEMRVDVHTGQVLPVTARLIGETSTPAFTELRFEIATETGLALGLVYRFHAAGVVEVELDERPWDGGTPWTRHAVACALPLRGHGESVPHLETRFPFYGFKDYAASFKQTGTLRLLDGITVLELGEEAVNGRRWYRRIHVARDADLAALLDAADEGLIVDVEPLRGAATSAPVTIDVSDVPEAIVAELRNVLPENEEGQGSTLGLRIVGEDERGTIDGDGFAVVPVDDATTELRACTRLGLFTGAREIARHLHGDSPKRWPLVARNPVMPFRGGGFGGGNFEVDFPYGVDEEWESVLLNLLDSGMETFACLGMWGNWKMPVAYTYMPELRSDDPKAYDESSGTLFSELDDQRSHGLKLLRFVQDRGGRVILWLPIGCVPSTFPEKYPEAILPGSVREFWGRPKATPCFTHAKYREYVKAFLRELTETYPIDGLMLVRDDNGTICDCDQCTAFLAQSRTGDAAWEQYLIIYDTLREMGFAGSVAVYPYFDAYTPLLEQALPDDMYIVGHGASVAGLTRSHDHVGHMADTWLDSLYTNFRLPPSPRMRRVMSNRPTFWIGGAYCGTELPWEAVGYFGWEPSATPNSFRYAWGARTFGKKNALRFARFSKAYEDLWELNARFMLPKTWLELTTEDRDRAYARGQDGLTELRQALAELETARAPQHEKWFAHVNLFPVYLDYHLHRSKLFAEIRDLTAPHAEAIAVGEPLPEDASEAVVAKYRDMHQRAQTYGQRVAEAPGAMLAATRNMTGLYKEWMAGYDAWLDPHLARPQFAGTVCVVTENLVAGKPGTLDVELVNTGLCPWIAESAQRIEFGGVAKELGLPSSVAYDGPPIAPGGRGTVTLEVTAPAEAGEGVVTVGMFAPYRAATRFTETEARLRWE
jgi:hypothetical protein